MSNRTTEKKSIVRVTRLLQSPVASINPKTCLGQQFYWFVVVCRSHSSSRINFLSAQFLRYGEKCFFLLQSIEQYRFLALKLSMIRFDWWLAKRWLTPELTSFFRSTTQWFFLIFWPLSPNVIALQTPAITYQRKKFLSTSTSVFTLDSKVSWTFCFIFIHRRAEFFTSSKVKLKYYAG